MAKFLTFCFALFVDLCMIIALSLTFIIIFDNALGINAPNDIVVLENMAKACKHLILVIVIAFIIYVLTSIICKTSVGLLIRNKSIRTKARRIACSAAVDFYFVYTVSLILDYSLRKIFYLDSFNTFIICLIAYGLIVVLFDGKTIGRYLLAIQISYSNAKSKILIVRDFLLKYLILLIIPYIACRIFGIVDSYAIFLNIIFFNLVLFIFSLLIFKQTLGSKIFKTRIEIVKQNKVKVILNFVAFLLFGLCSFMILRVMNNNEHKHSNTLLGFNIPYEFPKYPKSAAVEPYIDFLKKQNQSPKEYILSLFEHYDIVILQEKYHGESTQWELVEDIVKDSVFIHHVGHVFTEYGSVKHQNKIDRFLTTTFENDTLLEQETAVLMNYMSGGFYYFIKNLNRLNSTLPDSLKIQEHYTDCIDWDHFSDFGRVAVGANEINRDSLMAEVVITWYNEQVANHKRHKCLLITNYRHAFGYAGGVEKVKNSKAFRRLTGGNQAQYIWERFPNQTATVMQPDKNPNRTFFLPFYINSHKGIWDKAFEWNDHKPVGFDLKNTPFGEDRFEMYPLKGGKTELVYSDIFTGLIFNKPDNGLRQKYHPFHKFAIEEEARRKGITDTLEIQRKTAYLDNQSHDDRAFWDFRISLSNIMPILLFMLFSILLGLILVVHSFRIFFVSLQNEKNSNHSI